MLQLWFLITIYFSMILPMGAIHGCNSFGAIEYIGHGIFNIHVFVTFSYSLILLYGLDNHFHMFKYHVFSLFCRNFYVEIY